MENRPKRKSWREKLHEERDLPKVVEVPQNMIGKWGLQPGDTLLIPSPLDVDEMMKKVPEGKVVTIDEIRQALAKKYGATICCPITTGIFVLMVARAAAEAAKNGEKEVTPYWRTLKPKGAINEKYPGGSEVQRKLLEAEGHKVIKRGYKYVVVDYDKKLAEL
ncbi:MGMT family protein [bacterium]|nr:MGMT family protein [bacterium]